MRRIRPRKKSNSYGKCLLRMQPPRRKWSLPWNQVEYSGERRSRRQGKKKLNGVSYKIDNSVAFQDV